MNLVPFAFAASLTLAATPESDVPLTPATIIRFASADEGREVQAADDSFSASLSRFDRQCRMKAAADVSLADWKQFVVKYVRDWTPEEIEQVREALARLSKRLSTYHLPLPPVIRLVRTSGEEEANAAYTRGNAIIMPNKVLAYDANKLDRLLAHELFHILSRHDGALRSKLYATIGFSLCEPIEFPPSLAARRITNPDAPLVDCVISLPAADGQTHTFAPVLYASEKEYDAKKAPSIFQSLLFRLLLVEKQSGRWTPMLKSGQPVVVDPRKEAAFLEKIGKNTNYIIHPDEILADNFVHLVMEDKDLATPRIVTEMQAALK